MAKKAASSKALGEILRELRQRKALSQEALGHRAHVHRTYVGSVERGERNPSFESLRRILAALDVTWAEWGAALDRKLKGVTR